MINEKLLTEVINIETLPKSGSSRLYFRIFCKDKSLMATYNSNIEENEAFLNFSRNFKKIGLPVPEIIAVSNDKSVYIQNDLGSKSLFDYVNKCLKEDGKYNEETINLYKKAIDNLVLFQIKGHEVVDYSIAYPCPAFDKQSIIDDLNYFKYYFLKVHDIINFNETRLNDDFQRLADFAIQAPSDFFMYRDFQSRNIMIKDNHTYFIDYQGGRKGPLQYDIVSLLYQVKAQMNNNLRKELLSHYKKSLAKYINPELVDFDKYYDTFVLIRLMQVLGAYGFRGLIQYKQHFVESIPFALREIVNIKDNLNIPLELNELYSVLNQLEKLQSEYQPANEEGFTLTVNSFSYKKSRIPMDKSGNGGGYVFDCRGIINPGRYNEYKDKTGEDKEVIDFMLSHDETADYLNSCLHITENHIRNYLSRNFSALLLNFGCTGGQHRSVYFASNVARKLKEIFPNIKVVLNHIELDKHYVYEAE